MFIPYLHSIRRTCFLIGALMSLGSTTNALTLDLTNDIHWFNFAANPTSAQIAAAAGVTVAALGPLIYEAAPDNNSPSAAEAGVVAPNYDTFFLPAAGTGDLKVSWAGGAIANATFFLAKDGNEGSYLWDISGWNGTDDIFLTSPFSSGKRFSHIEFFGTSEGGTTNVPDGGSSALLLGVAVIGLASVARRRLA
jgi:hypothetical protein